MSQFQSSTFSRSFVKLDCNSDNIDNQTVVCSLYSDGADSESNSIYGHSDISITEEKFLEGFQTRDYPDARRIDSMRLKVTRSEQLYNLSRQKQEEGKRRREAIDIASLKRHNIKSHEDYGILPSSKCDAMYRRGIEITEKRDCWVARERDKKERRELDKIPGPDHFGTLPSSLSGNMYKKGMEVLHKKEHRRRLQSVRGVDQEMKLPSHLNDNMYTKSIEWIAGKRQKILKASQNSSLQTRTSDKKIPPSLAGKMYEKSIRWAVNKSENIEHFQKVRAWSEGRMKNFGTIPFSQAHHMYVKGQKFLKNRQRRIALLYLNLNNPQRISQPRSCERGIEQHQHAKYSIYSDEINACPHSIEVALSVDVNLDGY